MLAASVELSFIFGSLYFFSALICLSDSTSLFFLALSIIYFLVFFHNKLSLSTVRV
jgi:hypothetical protein